MRAFGRLALLWLLVVPVPAPALQTSENALRIEDSSEGNVVLGADQAVIEAGEVFGAVVLLWGNLDIHGQVNEVVVLSGNVTFHEGAKLNKSLVMMGGSFTSRGAQITPESVMYRAPGPIWRVLQSLGNVWRDHFTWMIKVAGAAFSCVLLWLVGMLLFRFSPTLQGITEGRLASQWPKNLAVGLFGSLVVPVFMVMLIISVLGIVLLPLYFLLLFLAGMVSYLGAALWAGHRLLPPKLGARINPLGFFLGLIAMQLLLVTGLWWAFLPALALWTLSWGGLLRGARSLWK